MAVFYTTKLVQIVFTESCSLVTGEKGEIAIMARRKNILNDSELQVMEKETKSYVESFREAIELFVKDCELRNLRPHTIKYYMNEFKACIWQVKNASNGN
ncbi:hypothetical protein [Bacillus rubiinfantis]|uniref:hypothetical protein n=1 Tax=Bacillus rubiinfantis TaxID=1499680 RepID=UPI001FEB9FBE|nr:hypothetical protein [Bacillus rubiinfantis]